LDPKVNAGGLNRRLNGYAVIHNVIARHHGKLEIDSKPGGGTKVSLILPAPTEAPATTDAAASEKFNAPVEPLLVPGLRVLVADDEPMIREVVRLYLSGDGHTVETAEDGSIALKKFKTARYDLVLTDRAMPELSGDQLAVEIKALRPDIPIILLTGFGDLMNADGEKPAGVDAVVAKPFTMASLREAVAEVSNRTSLLRA
jgi:CheY-like chemotaxis protein